MLLGLFSDIDEKVLCELADAKGRVKRITIPLKLFKLLEQFKDKRNIDDIQMHESSELSQPSDVDKFRDFVLNYCLPNKILIHHNEQDFSGAAVIQKDIMQFKQPLLLPWLINPIANLLTAFYNPITVVALFVLTIVSQCAFYLVYEPNVSLSFTNLQASDGFVAILLLIIGLFIHEFGHATAAYKYGSRKVEIGVGWYIYFLVFYADLSETWSLPRKQRALVDFGGMYFQGIYTLVLTLIYAQNPNTSLFYSILFLNFAFLWNLNPFLRMDGYWLASDILGIANLRKEATMEFRYLASRIFKQPIQRERSIYLSKKSRISLGVYAILSNLFFIWLCYILSDRIFFSLSEGLPNRLQAISNQEEWLEIAFSITLLAFQVFVLYFISRFVIKMLNGAIRWFFQYQNKANKGSRE
jgi:putative peptide zinc metalloprotease protein